MDKPVCETCNGDGEVFEDTADSRNEHSTINRPCPDCSGLDDDGFDMMDDDYYDDEY